MREMTFHADRCLLFRREYGRQAPGDDLVDQGRLARSTDLSGFEDLGLTGIARSYNPAVLQRIPEALQTGTPSGAGLEGY